MRTSFILTPKLGQKVNCIQSTEQWYIFSPTGVTTYRALQYILSLFQGEFLLFLSEIYLKNLVIFALTVETTSCWGDKKQGVYGELLCPKLFQNHNKK